MSSIFNIRESYKQGIAAMHEAYKKGLIDPELFTEDTSMSVAKRMDKGVARVGVSSGWTTDSILDSIHRRNGKSAEKQSCTP